jgi:hypothetical protein
VRRNGQETENPSNAQQARYEKTRRSRLLIAKELPELIEKDQRLHDAMQEQTTSGALRRRFIPARFCCPILADRALTDMDSWMRS